MKEVNQIRDVLHSYHNSVSLFMFYWVLRLILPQALSYQDSIKMLYRAWGIRSLRSSLRNVPTQPKGEAGSHEEHCCFWNQRCTRELECGSVLLSSAMEGDRPSRRRTRDCQESTKEVKKVLKTILAEECQHRNNGLSLKNSRLSAFVGKKNSIFIYNSVVFEEGDRLWDDIRFEHVKPHRSLIIITGI